MVTLGGLIGFPLLFSLGVGRTSAAHAGPVLAALPLPPGPPSATTFERRLPPPLWWLGAMVALLGETFLMSRDTASEAPISDAPRRPPGRCRRLERRSRSRRRARNSPGSFGTWSTTFWAIVAGGALLLPVLLWQGAAAALAAAGAGSRSAMLFLAGGSTLLAFAAWYWALSRGGIARMGALLFLPAAGHPGARRAAARRAGHAGAARRDRADPGRGCSDPVPPDPTALTRGSAQSRAIASTAARQSAA